MLLNFLCVIWLIGNYAVIGQCPEKALPRSCKCKRIISLCETNKPLINDDFTLLTTQANDKKDCCDFECNKKCDEAIRNQLYESSGDIAVSSADKAIDKLCKEVFPTSSENRGGFCLSSVIDLTGCPSDFVNIMEGLKY